MHALKILAVAVAAASLFGQDLRADNYPSHPIKLIVPLPPGTPPDTIARVIAEQLGVDFNTIVVENRPGAGGTIGTKSVAQADADGYTLALGSFGSLVLGPAVFPTAGYDPVEDFAPVGLIATAPYVLAVAPSVPVNNLRELIAYLKSNPGKLNFGGPTGTPPHFACERFKQETQTDIVHVPSRGGPQMIADLLSGQIQIICSDTIDLLPQIQAGLIRPLATMGSARLPELPDVPTTTEIGFPNLLVTVWFGIVAPRGVPADAISRLNEAINKSVNAPAVKESLAKLGAKPRPGSTSDFAQMIKDENVTWKAVLRRSGFNPQ
jgi:tripartite-type tricarboxylate transporter receptor subunit TctC